MLICVCLQASFPTMPELSSSEPSANFTSFTNYTFYGSDTASCSNTGFCTGFWPSKSVGITTHAILIIFSLIGNLFIIGVFYRNKSLRTTVHYFIVNMAISDLVIPLITLPWMISIVYHDGLWLVDGVLGTILCKFVSTASELSPFVSIFSMVAIAADRFHAVLFPLRVALFSRRKCRLTIAAIWIASVAFRSYFLYATKVYITYDTKLYCVVEWGEMLWMGYMSFFCLTCVSAAILTVLYSIIVIIQHRQKSNLHLAIEKIQRRAKENRQVTHMLVIIVVVFYVVWIPHHVYMIMLFTKDMVTMSCLFIWLSNFFICLFYPVVNPVVYYIFDTNYRQGFRELLCCSWPCSNKCKECFQPSVPPQCERVIVHNAALVNSVFENIEL